LSRFTVFPHVTRGERSFVCAMLGTSVLGAMFACLSVLRLSETGTHSSIAITYWTLFAGCVGGAGGLWATYNRWFGHAGTKGWLTASAGALLASGIGAVIGGTLILPFYGTMFGPFQLIMLIVQDPILGVVWFGMLACAHGLLRQWRLERDSIFTTRHSGMW